MTGTQVLEFTLSEHQYCLGIEYVSEIVRRSSDDVSRYRMRHRTLRA